jgi:S-adenosylmethionine:tRNA ribosyltransferase-isomerase
VRLEGLDFHLPEEAIAQRPAEPRDSCRLMYLPTVGEFRHAGFSDLPGMLRQGDTLVLNDSMVLPARVMAHKTTGGALELLFLRPTSPNGSAHGECWEALVRPSKRLRPGAQVVVAGHETLGLKEELGEGRWLVSAPPGCRMIDIMQAYGRLPLPPYIKSYPEEASVYQTVYASVPGSAAAPTAGLHFTQTLIEQLWSQGVDTAQVTLHVGLDTFLPIRESLVEHHHIHRETFEVDSETLAKLQLARSRGSRLVAVGTTVARVLETLALRGALSSQVTADGLSGSTDIFITPGFTFLAVDALLTNFHLPRSTVLALTMAFAGVERLKRAYEEALAFGYRFFSFGDAMLIEKAGAVHECEGCPGA